MSTTKTEAKQSTKKSPQNNIPHFFTDRDADTDCDSQNELVRKPKLWVLDTLHKKAKFSGKDFLSKCDQIRSFLRTWSYLLRKSLMENFIFFAAIDRY